MASRVTRADAPAAQGRTAWSREGAAPRTVVVLNWSVELQEKLPRPSLRSLEARKALEALVEGDRGVASRRVVDLAHERIGEAGGGVAVEDDGGPPVLGVLELEVGRSRDLFEGGDDLSPPETVRRLQHPHQLAQSDPREEETLAPTRGALDDGGRRFGLRRVVLYQVADENVGIEPGHPPPAARCRMAACMASTETALRRLPPASRPLNGPADSGLRAAAEGGDGSRTRLAWSSCPTGRKSSRRSSGIY